MDTEFKTDSSYTIIKGKFKAPASSSFGLFIAFLDNITKNVDKSDVISSHFSTIFENNINMPWNELEDLISKMKWKGEYATNLTHDIQTTMEDLFEPGTGRGIDIWHSIKKSQNSKAVSIFEEYLMRPTGDKNIKCEIAVETINKSDIEDMKRMREMRDNQDILNADISQLTQPAQQPSVEDSAVVLEMSLVLSPISGVPLTELKPGDKILIKISEQTSRGQYFIDLFNASQNNEILPIPATIESVTPNGKFYTVMVSLGPGVYGKAVEEDNVKAKRYDPAQDKRKQIPTLPQQNPAVQAGAAGSPDVPGTEKPKNKNMLLFIIGGMALLLLIILILLLV